MCIICNTPGLSDTADRFLQAFDKARRNMKEAEQLMLKAANEAHNPTVSKRYKTIHKKMVRQRKAWNSLEHQREHI